jgi:tRNA(fMet)-specific endonuclease VapC
MIVIDSDHLSVLLDPRDAKHLGLLARLESADDELGIPIVCVEEQLRAWLAQIRRLHDPHRQVRPYFRLAKLLDFLCDWAVLPFTDAAADEYVRLRSQRLKIGTQDQKIAATAISLNALLLSANLRDFGQVPGLRTEDWLPRLPAK